jgi:hypothetical protein
MSLDDSSSSCAAAIAGMRRRTADFSWLLRRAAQMLI